jgi:flagellar L-ring protein precursor FlgH
MKTTTRKTLTGATALALAVSLSACGAGERLANVGKTPQLTSIENPTLLPDYQPVSMPMPAPELGAQQPASLWRQGSRAFFKDQRASRVGDILTVLISIDDEAEIDNTSSRSRAGAEGLGIDHFMGYEQALGDFLPDAYDPSDMISADSTSTSTGTGTIARSEDIELRIAAIITQVLPNGNMVLNGRQEVRVNNEVRELQVVGVIRPEDITAVNTVAYDKIAEARIAYGGRGQVTDMQQPRYGQQVYDIIAPF